MQALSERIEATFAGAAVVRLDIIGFSTLKTVLPSPADLAGATLVGAGRRAKYLVLRFLPATSREAPPGRGDVRESSRAAVEPGTADRAELDRAHRADKDASSSRSAGSREAELRLLVHLGNAGRLDIEEPARSTQPRGALARLTFADARAFLVREYGTQRKAGLWVLAAGDEGPLASLGPEVDDDRFAETLLRDDSNRQVHTLLRDQHVIAGIGRGYADDALNLAGVSPFASLRSLDEQSRRRLVEAVRAVIAAGLGSERGRSGGLSATSLGGAFAVHNRAGLPCPRCATTLQRVAFDSHEVVYCPLCQTKGKVLADRRMSRLLR